MHLLQHCYNYQCNQAHKADHNRQNQLKHLGILHISVHNIPLYHSLNPLPDIRYTGTGFQQAPEQVLVLVLVQVQVLALEPVWTCCPLQACCHWLQYFYYRCQCFSLAYLPCHQKLRFLSLPEQLILRLQKPLLRYGCLSYSCCHCRRKNIIGSIHILHIKKTQKITHKKSLNGSFY